MLMSGVHAYCFNPSLNSVLRNLEFVSFVTCLPSYTYLASCPAKEDVAQVAYSNSPCGFDVRGGGTGDRRDEQLINSNHQGGCSAASQEDNFVAQCQLQV